MDRKDERRRLYRFGAAGLALVAFLFLYVDNWSRDLVSYEAALTEDASDPLLRPFSNPRPVGQLAAAVKQAARRIGNWEYVGEGSDGPTAVVYFVRTNRLLRFKDDIVIRIDDEGDRRTISADSTARFHVGDLGRNPRNLKRLMTELRIVLEGSVPARLLGSAP